MKYSPSKNAFYPEEIPYTDLPTDLITVTQSDYQDAINRPLGSTFSVDAQGKITITLPSAAHIIAVQTEAIKTERDRRWNEGGYQAEGKWFHSDQLSRIQQMGLLTLGANIPAGLQWKTMDGSFVTMTPELAQAIFAAATASDQAIFEAAQNNISTMSTLTDPATWDPTSNFPKVYGE